MLYGVKNLCISLKLATNSFACKLQVNTKVTTFKYLCCCSSPQLELRSDSFKMKVTESMGGINSASCVYVPHWDGMPTDQLAATIANIIIAVIGVLSLLYYGSHVFLSTCGWEEVYVCVVERESCWEAGSGSTAVAVHTYAPWYCLLHIRSYGIHRCSTRTSCH